MPIAAAMQCPAVLSNTFLAHRRGSESCAQPRRQWPRRRAKNALRYVPAGVMWPSAELAHNRGGSTELSAT